MSLEYHYQTIGYILADLVNHGLRKVDYSDENAMEVMKDRIGDEDEVLQTFSDVLHWMIDEGMIRATTIEGGGVGDFFNGVQLTSKGIGVITAPPIAGSPLDKSIEKTIAEAPKGSLGGDVYAKIGSLVGGLLGGYQQSFG